MHIASKSRRSHKNVVFPKANPVFLPAEMGRLRNMRKRLEKD